jgi:hypothetical protein
VDASRIASLCHLGHDNSTTPASSLAQGALLLPLALAMRSVAAACLFWSGSVQRLDHLQAILQRSIDTHEQQQHLGHWQCPALPRDVDVTLHARCNLRLSYFWQQQQQQQQQQQRPPFSSHIDLASFDVTVASAVSFGGGDSSVDDLQASGI